VHEGKTFKFLKFSLHTGKKFTLRKLRRNPDGRYFACKDAITVIRYYGVVCLFF